MPSASHIQTNFTAGEFSPRLIGRSDLNKYNNACETLQNFQTQKHGGITRRPGSRFVAETKLAGSFARMIPFKFSVVQTYSLEFGELYIRFFRDKGRLQHGLIRNVNTALWNSGTEIVTIITNAAHGLQAGETVSIQNAVTTNPSPAVNSLLNGTHIVLTVVSVVEYTYALSVDPFVGGTYIDGSGRSVEVVGNNLFFPTEIVSPYTAAQLPRVKFIQSADILYLVHPDVPPQTLTRRAGADNDPEVWTISEFTTVDGPYLTENLDDLARLDITAVVPNQQGIGDIVTIQPNAVAVALINGGRGFQSGDVDRIITWQAQVDFSWTWATITVVNNTDSVDARLESPTAEVLTSAWRLGSWGVVPGFPRCNTFHKSRLAFGGNADQPQTLWQSRIADFNNFVDFIRTGADTDIGVVLDDHALIHTIDDDRVNTIHWIKSEARGIAILTNGGVFIGSAPSQHDPVTPTNFTITRQIADGSSEIAQPHQASEVILFIKDAGRKILELVFRFEDDQFVAPDLTLLSEHITLSGILDTAYSTEPDNILWCVLANGQLIGMTYERPEDVVAWHRHKLGGSFDGSEQPIVESITVIRDGDDDLLWMTVKRTIDGSTARFVEFVPPPFKDDETGEDGVFVDAAGTFTSSAAIVSAESLEPMQIVTATNHGLGSGDRVRFRDMQGMTELNDKTFLVTASTPTTFLVNDLDNNPVDGSAFGTHIPNTGATYKETTLVIGLAHLAGETLTILADGAVVPTQVVSAGGAIILDDFASIIHVGLPYTSRMKTMPLIPKGRFDPRGMTHRVDTVFLYLYRSLGGLVGSEDGLDPIIIRSPTDEMGVRTPLFTGVHKITLPQRSGQQAQVIVETSDPLPLNLLSIVSKMSVDEV